MSGRNVDLDGAEAILGHRFRDRSLGINALQPSVQGFSRLEFLGDAILGLVVFTLSEYTATPRPEASRLVSNDVLDELVHSTFASYSPANTGDVIEALVGAVYLDAGFDCAASAITTVMVPHLGAFDATTVASNAASLSPRGLMYLGATTSSAVVANYLCQDQPQQNHKWFSEERSRLLRNSRLAEISRAQGLCSSELRGNERKDAAATDALDQHIAKQFLTLGWDEAKSPITELLALEQGV